MKKLLLALLLVSAFAFGQTAINGTIRGHATDASGSAIAAAKVTAINAGTGFERDVESNEDGLFVLPNLPLGSYTLSIQKSGFNTDKHTGIVLDAGMEAVIDAQLKVGSVETTVEVTGGAPIVDPSRTSTGRTISFEETNNLPLTSRNPYNFVLFQPGVSGHPNPELGIPRLMNTNGLADRTQYQLDHFTNRPATAGGLRHVVRIFLSFRARIRHRDRQTARTQHGEINDVVADGTRLLRRQVLRFQHLLKRRLLVVRGAAVAALDVFVVEHLVAALLHFRHHFPGVPGVNPVVPRRGGEQHAWVFHVLPHVVVRGECPDEFPLLRVVRVAVLVHPARPGQ